VNKLIVGTKTDLKDKIVVEISEVKEFCESLDLDCIFVSSKIKENVDAAFWWLAYKIWNSVRSPPASKIKPPPKRNDCVQM
jgi:hypothetical protein